MLASLLYSKLAPSWGAKRKWPMTLRNELWVLMSPGQHRHRYDADCLQRGKNEKGSESKS
jgi:hypothetical protein